MKIEQLKKLYDLMKVITMSYKGEKEAIEDCLEIDRIIWELINERHTKEDLLWCNEKWKSYEGKYKFFDLSKYEREHEKTRHPIGYSYTNIDGREICLATIGVFDNKEDKGMVRIREFYDENGNHIRQDDWEDGALNHKSEGGWFKNGEQDGLWIHWYENGNKRIEGTFKDGKLDGLSTWWYENGNKEGEGTYKDGKEDGLETGWYENGQKKFERTYKDGKEDGKWTGWYKNGQKSSEGTYKDGKKDGKWTGWYKDGQKGKEGTFKDGELDGLQTTWYENGKKKKEGTFKYGTSDLSYTEWYENGKKEREKTFKDGIEISYKYWDKDGNIIE